MLGYIARRLAFTIPTLLLVAVAVFTELHRCMAKAVPIPGIYNPFDVPAAGPQVRGYRTWPAGNERFWGVWKE